MTVLTEGGGGIGLVLLGSPQVVSGVTEVEFTDGIDGNGDLYLLVATNVTVGTDNTGIGIRTSSDGGATFDSGVSDYTYYGIYSGGIDGYGGAATNDRLQLFTQGNATNEASDFTVRLFHPANAGEHTRVDWLGGGDHATQGFLYNSYCGKRNEVGAVNGIQIKPVAGTISGTFALYKFKNV